MSDYDQHLLTSLSQSPLGIYQITPPRTDDELWNYVYRVWGVAIPRVRVCENHCSPFEAFSESFFARNRLSVWVGSRRSGKTLLLALLSLTEQVLLRAKISLLGGSGEQSRRVHDYISGKDPNVAGQFWASPNAPRWLLDGEPTKMESRTIEGGLLKALMASSKSVRGSGVARLRIDEADEMEQELLDMALPTVLGIGDVPAQITISSTHHRPNGVMTEMKRRCEENGYPLRSWCFKEVQEPHGWLPVAEIEAIRKSMPAELFRIEFELGEPRGDNRMLTEEVVNNLFDKKLGIYTGKENQLVLLEHPLPNNDYFHGVDWAKSVDNTVMTTAKLSQTLGIPHKWVRWLRMHRMGWPIMCGHYDEALREYGGPGVHDRTGVGGVCQDFLEEPSEGFDFSNAKESALLIGEYITALEQGEYVAPHIAWAYNEHKFCIAQDSLISCERGLVPIQEVLPNQDNVWTREGWRLVKHVSFTGLRETMTLELANGNFLQLTPDHEVATSRGWLQASFLGTIFGLREAMTNPATSGACICNEQVSSGIGMPFRAVSYPSPPSCHSLPSKNINPVRNWFQMCRITATRISTGMIQFLSSGDASVRKYIGQTMGKTFPHALWASSIAKLIPIILPVPTSGNRVNNCSGQNVGQVSGTVPEGLFIATITPSRSFEDGLFAIHTAGGLSHVVKCNMTPVIFPVWDIGTYEEPHEFCANGIVVHNCSYEQLYGSGDKHHKPDSIVSAALMHRARRYTDGVNIGRAN